MAGSLFIFAGCTNSTNTADKESSAQSPQITEQQTQVQHKNPNIILVFLDDAGYGDFGITGSSTPTPAIDALATNGVQLTQFYDASSVCSASRAALMTGRYANRFSFNPVIFPHEKVGLPEKEQTLAELLKSQGYSTHMFGKWHLGHQQGALPLSHGFDEYYGIPYSNDMWPYKRDINNKSDEQAYVYKPNRNSLPLPMIEGNHVVTPSLTPEDQKSLTKDFTDRAIKVIKQKSEQPFFIYLPYSASHIPIFVRDEIKGKSGGSLYQDVIYEYDQQIARMMKALTDKGIDKDTLVIFTSDNGPWTVYGDHGGSAADMRGFKMTTFEGGIRVFTAMHWPNGFKQGLTLTEPAMTIDILPTIAEIIGATPRGEKLDGRSLLATLSGKQSPDSMIKPYFNFHGDSLKSMRYGKWKLHLPGKVRTVTKVGNGGFRGDYGTEQIPLSLYDLTSDPAETTNLVKSHPEVVEQMTTMMAEITAEITTTKQPVGQYGKD